MCIRDSVEVPQRDRPRRRPAAGAPRGGRRLTAGVRGLRVRAVLPLTGRYAFGGAAAARGLALWAEAAGAALRVDDCGDDAGEAARLSAHAAPRCDLLFAPYGSGLARAAADALAGEPQILWNHGAAAVPRTGARVVDVIAPAERYWTGLAAAVADPAVLRATAVFAAPTPFGRGVAAGAVASLASAGAEPLLLEPFDAAGAAGAAARAGAAGARLVVACGRFEDDLALGRALAGGDAHVALVACGVPRTAEVLGEAVVGWLGPCPWPPDAPPAPVPLPRDAPYPAAQAVAAGLVAARAVADAGTTEAGALWDAVRATALRTFLGPFRLDAEGRQVAAVPRLVRWHPGPPGPRMRTVWEPPDPDGGR